MRRSCYLTDTARYLPGPCIANDRIGDHLGTLDGETHIANRVLRLNGICGRHYAQDANQNATCDVYQLAARAAWPVADVRSGVEPTFLAAGTTHAPLSGPGIATLAHARLQDEQRLDHPVEIASHGGICSSASAAMMGAIRAIQSGEHDVAVSIGAEHASEVLKSSRINIVDDRAAHAKLRDSQWFMSVFLRFMLSDGAGAFRLSSEPADTGTSWRVNWTYARSFAHETPLCMKLDNRTGLVSQHIPTLTRYLLPSARQFIAAAMAANNDSLSAHDLILPHLSSFFFKASMDTILRESSDTAITTRYWTNLASAGNTGAASIYIMLDEYLQRHAVPDGQRILLFIPESGQFNFVLASLTAVRR